MTAEPRSDRPIACSLDAGSLADRVGEWRALVATSVTAVDADPTAVRLSLEPSEAALVAAVDLAQREKQCCPFFDVVVEIAERERTLTLRVPNGAEDVMSAFVAILTA